MNCKNRLKLLIPVFQSVFSVEDINKLQEQLRTKNYSKGKKKKKRAEGPLLSILISSFKDQSVFEFINFLNTCGKNTLAEFTEKFMNDRLDSHVDLLIKHWTHIITCNTALDGLHVYIKGLSVRTVLTPNHWLEIIYQLVKAGPKAICYFTLQIIKNVAYYQQQEDGDLRVVKGKECFVEVFKPIFKSNLNDEHFLTIARDLSEKKIITKDDTQTVKLSVKKHKAVLKFISKSFTQECLTSCIDSIKQQGFSSFADILDLYFHQNVPCMLWLLVHWEELIGDQARVGLCACQLHLLTETQFFQLKGNIWLVDVILEVTRKNTEQCSLFLKEIETLLNWNLIIDLSQMITAPEQVTKNSEHKSSLTIENEVVPTTQKQSTPPSTEQGRGAPTQTPQSASAGRGRVQPAQTYLKNSENLQTSQAGPSNQTQSGSVGRGRGLSTQAQAKENERKASMSSDLGRVMSIQSQTKDSHKTSQNKAGMSTSSNSDAEFDQLAASRSRKDNSNQASSNDVTENESRYDLRPRSKKDSTSIHQQKEDASKKSSREQSAIETTGSHDHQQQESSDDHMSVTESLPSLDGENEPNVIVDAALQNHVEFCLLVDKKCDLPIAKEGQVFVYLEHNNKYLHLQFDPNRSVFFTSTQLNSGLQELVYKYLWVTVEQKELWEKLPYENSGIVNRKFKIKPDSNKGIDCMVLYDVSNFSQEIYPRPYDIGSMYTRNIIRHLPKINLMKFGAENEQSINFDTCLNELENWYYCANEGITYLCKPEYGITHSFQTEIRPSCLSELWNYVQSNETFGNKETKCDRTAVCQRILVHVAILIMLYRNKISIRENNHERLCLALIPLGIGEAEVKQLYMDLKSCQKYMGMIKEIGDAILFLNKQMKHPLLFVTLLPLYYALRNNGNCSYNEKLWSDVVHVFTSEKKLDNVKEEYVTAIAPHVVEISKLFPQLLTFFQLLIPPYVVLHMLNLGKDLSYLKQSAHIIKLLTKINMREFESHFSSSKSLDWILLYLNDIEQRCLVRKLLSNDVIEIVDANQAVLVFLQNKAGELRNKHSTYAFEFFKIAVIELGCLSHLLENDSTHSKLFGELFQRLLEEIEYLINKDQYPDISEELVQRWNFFLTPRMGDVSMNMTFATAIGTEIQNKICLKLKRPHSNVLDVFEKDLDKWKASPELQACMSEAVFQYAINLTQEETRRVLYFFTRSGKTERFKQIIDIFQRTFLEAYTKEKKQHANHLSAVLKFASQWPFFVHFFNFFEDAEKKKLLDSKNRVIMDRILHQLNDLKTDLEAGTILFEHVEIICSSKINFREVFGLLEKDCEKTSKVCQRNNEEMQAFLKLKKILQYCYDLCKNNGFKGSHDNLEELKQLLQCLPYGKAWRDIVDMQWKDVDYINIAYFNLDQQTVQAVNEIFSCKVADNALTKSIWDEEVGKMIEEKACCDDRNPAVELDDVVNLWKKFKNKIASIKKRMILGLLLLCDVELLFGKFRKEKSFEQDVFSMVKAICEFPVDEKSLNVDSEYGTVSDEEYESVESNIEDWAELADDEETASSSSEEIVNDLVALEIFDDAVTNNELIVDELSNIERDRYFPEPVDFMVERAVNNGSHSSNQNHSNTESEGEEEDDIVANGTSLSTVPYPVVDDALIKIRVEQICYVFTLQHNQEVAAVFHELKECLELQGDFSFLDIVLNQTNMADAIPMIKLTVDVIEASKRIKDITIESVQSVTDFLQHRELIEWLRENMNRKEVKVMSDLAMISAGENTMEVDKVSCFLSAVMGYAPFLFDLNDKNADLKTLIEAFDKLPKENERTKLKMKWDKTAQYLDWLKQIKDFHGSVEKSSLSRAQDINSKGVYVIGGEKEKIPTAESSLKLNILAEDTDGHNATTLSELHNLESRLMLIAGEAEKGLDDVRVFTEVLALVENLTNVYVKLKAAGCLLFSSWTARICCRSSSTSSDVDPGVLGSMEIHFDDHSPSILCNEQVAEELKKLTAVMEDVHGRWKQSLDEKRSQFYHLNHFNIQQIMYLCQELAKLMETNVVPDQVCTLLEFVKPNVRPDEIVALLKEATKYKDIEEDEIDEADEDEAPIPQCEQKRKMVRLLVDEGIVEKLAKAAVQHCGLPLDRDECFIKALELEPNEYDADDEINDLVREFDKEAGFGASTSEVRVVQSVVSDRSHLTLRKVIDEIMSKQSDERNMASIAVKTICERYLVATAVTSLNDCISIEHLGILLNKLNAINDVPNPRRKFPSSLEEGKPNLLICPENDMYSVLLSLYMHSDNQPLPTLSEVLLCSENTSKEEVDLFLRRAICIDATLGSCIFSLAFADKLSFKVANETNSLIKKLEKESGYNEKYRLVVLCSSKQHSDYIASFLYENRMDYQARVQSDDIQKYLSKHLNLHKSHALSLPMPSHYDLNTSVLVVTSHRAGMGKSLHIERWRERKRDSCRSVVIRLLEKHVDEDEIMQRLLASTDDVANASPHFIHFDITPSVHHGFSPFFFNLLVLGGFKDGYGTLWRRQAKHIYFIEYTIKAENTAEYHPKLLLDQNLFNMLPSVRCLSPCEVLDLDESIGMNQLDHVLKMDKRQFDSEMFQRPYQYLDQFSRNQNLDRFTYSAPEGTPALCIKALLKECSLKDPTWSELRHFASFLNNQLQDCEQSFYCSEYLVGGDSGLSGFKSFVVRFMIRMSQDFATPSLPTGGDFNDVFQLHQLRRHWEEDVHPYLFFNEDNMTMTFLNFSVDSNGNLLDPKNSLNILVQGLLPQQLLQGLKIQRVSFNRDFDKLSRPEKLTTIYRVMGLDERNITDPDPTYELTTDNVLKILAIHMRLRCGIPVVVMGETGCGKTRMIEFMSKLKALKKLIADRKNQGSGEGAETDNARIENMVIVKVHGGITVQIIQKKMKEAAELARENKTRYNVDTLLFLDEANTTEAIYAIKEYVCDGTIDGEPMRGTGLQIICACNPYRKHTQEAIDNMAEAGLGFRVKTEDTTDKLGDVPMRCLVYRVIALPPSMQPLVWDFGQLSAEAEKIYIQQMVGKLPGLVKKRRIVLNANDINLIVAVLSASQSYMREERSQCLFVSLRDVERCLQCFLWFYENSDWLYELVDDKRRKSFPRIALFSRVVLRTLIHAIGMCYHVTLENRLSYRECICRTLNELFNCTLMPENILDEINACQTVFSDELNLEDNIARNEALKENTFMITMCIEMRIPLFVIGKPGSSKSLAKTVVTDAMQGGSSESEVYQRLKQIHVLSFQCSAVSDAVGIAAVFNQCEKVQANQNPDKFVSVVVLDEVGLAEDSPKMPLKVLHPLLEGSSADLENNKKQVQKNKMQQQQAQTAVKNPLTLQRRVGFVGISNWALDPAKMNRGIFVFRGDPNKHDLQLTAKGIFSDLKKFKEIDRVVKLLTDSYLEIREQQDQEFFGLRDYYGLLKMIFSVVKSDDVDLDCYHVSDAIKRNFSGGKIDCCEIFVRRLQEVWPDASKSLVSVKQMIQENLMSINECESRFLLLLTNRFAAINLINKVGEGSKFEIIFGSSFPRDSDYIELCRNINKIKICMESGCTVVLLNLRDLYESLYDALNQHYVTFAGQRYVDLGLGGHRVKCRVAKDFRLIVIEDKNVVYNEFPIPLINRLEKYVFSCESILDGDHLEIVKRLQAWVKSCVEIDIPMHKRCVMKQFVVSQCFPGYNEDSAASAVLNVLDSANTHQSSQFALLNTATVDAVYRLHKSKLKKEADKLQKLYLLNQSHDNLVSLFQGLLQSKDVTECPTIASFLFEVTSFSQILSDTDRVKMEEALGLPQNSVMLLTLQQFQTLDEYNAKVKSFFEFSLEDRNGTTPMHILFIQCPQAHKHSNLIACARFSIKNMVCDKFWSELQKSHVQVFVAFLYTMDRLSNSSDKSPFSFHSSDFTSVFVDELRPSVDYMGPPSRIFGKCVSKVFEQSVSSFNYTMSKLPSKFASEDFILDPFKLIRDSVSGALVKIKNFGDDKDRNRVQLLQQLFKDNHPVGVHFQSFLLKRIIDLLKQRDQQIDSFAWSTEEACSHEALHEGGTFTKTLWLRLKRIVTLVLAKIVSVLDEDDNLDLICKEKRNASFVDFWLEMFQSDSEVCTFSLSEILQNSKNMEVRGTACFSCRFPFSRRITECFSRIWNFSQDCTLEHRQTMFFRKVEELRLTAMVLQFFSSNQLTILEHYIHDLIHLQTKFLLLNQQEFQLLADTFKALFVFHHQDNSEACSNFLAVAYSLLAASEVQLQQMHSVLELQPELLSNTTLINKWTDEQSRNKNFVVHALVYQEVLLGVEKRFDVKHLESFKEPARYHQWKGFFRKVLNMKIEVALLDPDSKVLAIVNSKRNALAFVDLFLSVLMPDDVDKADFLHYWSILASLAIRLWKGAAILALNDSKFLNIVIRILQSCCKDLFLKLLLSWKEIKCNACPSTKIADPVILPCKHYFCYKCIQHASISRQCSVCRENFPEDYKFEVAQLEADKKKEFHDFKQNCTSFFLQYLSTLCFPAVGEAKRDATISDAVWRCLQNLVVGEKETREMTPIDMENFDETPTVRSFILQLLLRFNRVTTQAVLENHFKEMKRVTGDNKQLMIIYVRCVEDLLQIDADKSRTSGIQFYHEFIDSLIAQVEDDLAECTGEIGQMKVLNVVASTRFLMKTASESAHELCSANKEVKENADAFLRSVCDLLERFEIPKAKTYFVTHLCRRFGFSDYQNFLNVSPDLFVLIPSEINPHITETSSLKSSLFVLGDVFIETRTRLISVESEDDIAECVDELSLKASQSSDCALQIFHAVCFWIENFASEDGKGFRMQFLEEFLTSMEQSTNVCRNLINFFRDSTGEDQLVSAISSNASYLLGEFFQVAGSTVAASSHTILGDLNNLMTMPHLISSYFLPTMPQSVFFDAEVQAVVKAWTEPHSRGPPKPYLCPFNHVYYIGDCTQPNQRGTCPDCRRLIGGGGPGGLQPGNRAGVLEERTQAGYLLEDPANRPAAPTPERSCSKLDICTIRMFLHAVMLHASRSGSHVMSHLKQMDQDSTEEFLFKQLQIDFSQFLDCLGKSAEDGALLLHQIMKKMRTQNFAHNYRGTLTTLQGRKIWEEEFHRNYLSPAFENADQLIEEARKICWSNQKQNDLERLVFEIPDPSKAVVDENDDELLVNSSYLWNYEISVTISNLRQNLEGLTSHDKREGKLLKLLLNEADLTFVQYLPSILLVQSSLIKRYQRKVDASDVEKISLGQYCAEGDRVVSDAQFQLYSNVWNSVKENLPYPNAYNVAKDELASKMDMESPVSMCLPSTAGKGRCALLMVDYLIDKQNKLLLNCQELLPSASFTQISIEQLSIDDLVCIDNEQALMPLVLSNSQYQVTVGETGSKHKIVYRIAALEKQVAEKFIINKKLLNKQSLPLIKYLQDTGLGDECEQMKDNVPQKPLPLKICQKFDELVSRSRLPDICEGVRTLTLVISYLAKLKSEPSKLLEQYVTNELLMPSEEAAMIPKTAKLCHTMALYERLSWQRSRIFVLDGQDPFVNVTHADASNDADVTDDEVTASLKGVDLPQLQLELNSLILLKSGLDKYASLRDNLIAYIESKYCDEESGDLRWCDRLSERLLVVDAPRVFKLSVKSSL